MRFLNPHVLLYCLIVLISDLLLYFLTARLGIADTPVMGLVNLVYVALLVISAILINNRDEYSGYFGFNYHLVTYVICMGLPLLLQAAGLLQPAYLGTTAAVWGAGIIVHLLIFLFGFRKHKLRSYNKTEIFK